MISIVDNIVSHPLYKAFDIIRDNGNVPQKDIDTLKGIVCKCAEDMEHILKTIPETFKQYTLHDLTHSYNVATKIYEILPKQKIEGENTETIYLNALELAVLWLSILLHDSGMAVTSKEKDEIISSPDYDDFLVPYKREISSIDKDIFSIYNHESAIFAEYIRRNHAERSRDFVKAKLKSLLEFKGDSLCDIVGMICESHCWGINVSSSHTDSKKYVGHLSWDRPFNGYLINEQYLACCLRLGNILDFDYTRSPKIAMPYIDFTEEKSIKEWHKNMGVQNLVINEHLVKLLARCENSQQFADINDFCGWIDDEIQECTDLLENSESNVQNNYIFNLSPVVKRKITMADESFVPGNFRFQLDYDEILKLLMDKALYPDPALFLRELLQNSLDACRMLDAIAKKEGYDSIYKPKIVVYDYSEDKESPRIVFQDNGIGMSEEIVKKYFLRVGKSYYRSDDFIRQQRRLEKDHKITLDACSNFGIGFLSCFLAGDSIEVETYRLPHEPLLIKIDGVNKYFTIQKIDNIDKPHFPLYIGADFAQDTPPKYPGTKVTIYLKDKWREFTNEEKEKQNTSIGIAALTLKNFAVNIDYPLTILKATDKKNEFISTPIPAWGWETGEPPLPGNLPEFWRKYLVPVRIPFEEYEETKDIRGSTWFWFLKADDGKPTLKYKHLTLETSYGGFKIKIIEPKLSIATILQYIVEEKKLTNEQIDEILDKDDDECKAKLQELVDNTEFNFINASKHQNYLKANGVQIFDIKERSIIKKYIHNFSLSGCAREGYELKESDWIKILNKKFNTSKRREINDEYSFSSQFSCSSHGIMFPSGLLTYDPFEGRSDVHNIFKTYNIIANIDLRSENSVIPAANRLFIPYEWSEKLRLYLGIVLFNEMHKLKESLSSSDKDWSEWIETLLRGDYITNSKDDFCESLLFLWQQENSPFRKENIEFLIRIRGEKKWIKFNEITTHFSSPWVPYVSYWEEGDGIIRFDIDSILKALPTKTYNDKKLINVSPLF